MKKGFNKNSIFTRLVEVIGILIRTKEKGDFLTKKGFTELRIYESTEQLWIRDKSEE